MHVQMPQKDLEDAATIVSSLVSSSGVTNPVLSNLLIEATEKGVQFRGTDMESLVIVNLGATVTRPGITTVPADTFSELVKLLPPMGEVSVEDIGGKVHVQCEANKYQLMTLPADDFPQWTGGSGETKFQISQKVLKTLIDATTYALPVKDHRRVLLGVNFEIADNSLRLTATDGKKLARISTSVPEIEGQATTSAVVPRKLLDNLSKFLRNEGPVEVEIATGGSGGKQITFRFSNVFYRGNCIDGKYPDCDTVIPKEFPTQIDFNRDLLLQAVRRAGVVVDNKNKSIIMKFQDNECRFSSAAHDVGTFDGKVNLDYTGPMFELAFNATFLIETLSRFPTPELKLMVKSPTAPTVFRARESEEDRLALLMPIKLADVRPPAPSEPDEEDEEA